MTRKFRSLPADRPLREALCLLLDLRAETKGTPNLVVTKADGSFAGVLTPRSLLQALLGSWDPEQRPCREKEELARSLLNFTKDRLDTPVGELMVHDLPRARPRDRLLRLMELISDRRLECVPVLEEDRPVGIVLQADVFRAAADLALAPEEAEDASPHPQRALSPEKEDNS